MNVNTIKNYVNQDVDDTFSAEQIVLWFNRGIAQYNLIPPLTTYKSVQSSHPAQNLQTIQIFI